jgi:aspartyl-tRNA(Asn)/glutamyl-tRNA(Gln) amidotransferase subunit B
MEFVFEPNLKDGEEAAALVKELALILQRLDTCSCKMAGIFNCYNELKIHLV